MATKRNTGTTLTGTYIVLGILLISAIVVLGLKLSGLGGNGAIALTVPEPASVVYFNNREQTTTEGPNDTININGLNNKTQTILVAKEGFWPWAKNLKVENDQKVKVISWSLPKLPEVEDISRDNPDYSKILNEIQSAELPNKDTPLTRENISVWAEENIIVAGWDGDVTDAPYYFCEKNCEDILVIFEGDSAIQGLAFYKDRNDVVFFSNESGVFVIEINTKGTQNFQPVMRVNSPRFTVADDSKTLYILENGNVSKIGI